MKKLLVVGSIVVGLSVNALAATTISWTADFAAPIKTEDGTTDAPISYLAVLMWSPDGVRDAFNPADPLGLMAGPTGDMQIWSQPLNALGVPGLIFSDYTGNPSDNSLAGGFVYTRVFSDPTGTTGFYGDSGEFDGPWQVATSDPSTTLAHTVSGLVVNQVVPEPTTLALLGVGVGTILYRRRRRNS